MKKTKEKKWYKSEKSNWSNTAPAGFCSTFWNKLFYGRGKDSAVFVGSCDTDNCDPCNCGMADFRIGGRMNTEETKVHPISAEKVQKMQLDTERMFDSVFTYPFAVMRRSVLRELGLWEEKNEKI